MTAPLASIRVRARVVSVGVLLALAACSNTSGTANPPYRPGAPPPETPAGIGSSNGHPDAGMPSGNVMVQILAPMSGSTLPTSAAADVSAKVTIVDGTDLVDPSTVLMVLTDGVSGATVASSPLIGPVPVAISEFHGKLSLHGVKTGAYKITVRASSTTGVTGTATVDVGVDDGPLITVVSPIQGHSYKESLFVQVTIDSGAFGPTMMDSIQATIAGMPITLLPTGQPNQFRADKPFSLTMPTALEGEQIFTVSAKNANGTRSDRRVLFFVDVRGPKITQTSPSPGEIVGGVIKIQALISDLAGVNESSVQAILGDKTTPQFRVALQPQGGGIYSVAFDTKVLTTCSLSGGTCGVRPVLSFRAADLLGNETNEAYTIAIDNFGPVADLDPPSIRTSKLDMGLRCSHEFDPLDHDIYAGDAPNDLCQVPQMFDVRARIQDTGNGDFGNGSAAFAAGIKAVPISGVDQDRTAVYILDNTVLDGEPQALVVDTDGDGFCDDINPKLETTTTPLTKPRQALKIRMRPVPPAGGADYATPDPNLPAVCLPGQDPEVPEDLCKPGPQPSIAISYAGGLPAIWTIEPVVPPAGPGYCFGSQLDTFSNNVTSVKKGALTPNLGWKCIAIVVTDKAGNRSTSAPLRVYLDDYAYGGSLQFCKAPPANAGPPPNCTGTFDKATNVVSPKACQTRSFKRPPGQSEICYKGDCN